jgi:hypothetical protein
MELDWSKDKPEITGEYFAAMNTCNIRLFGLIGPNIEQISEAFPLIEYVIERMGAAIELTQLELLWDADILVRSALETMVKFGLIAEAEDKERPQLLQEFWHDLTEIYTIKLSDQAKKNLSRTGEDEIHRLAYTPQVLSEEEEARLREKWPKAARTQLEQKWSFGGVVAALSKKNKGTPMEAIDFLTHIYRMSSHIAHGDEMGINLIRERKSRIPQEQADVSIAHYLRLMGDGFNICFFTALYTCRYLNTDPTPFYELFHSLRKYDAITEKYHMAPFKDKLYDRYRI